MQLFFLNVNAAVQIGEEIQPITLASLGLQEVHLENLLVRHPGLLNINDYQPESAANADLLIIDRQPMTVTQKRADLFGIDRAGYLIIVEIKRDAKDEESKKEAMEFQAIRYAAASRKLTVDGILERFAAYLQRVAGAAPPEVDFKEQALQQLCEHLSNEEREFTTAEELAAVIQPKAKQKIYLVASDFAKDLLSGCAWLREHHIDIFCFRLRPYNVAGQLALERERLIPPPELDDFLLEMAAVPMPGAEPSAIAASPTPSNKPTTLTWLDDPDTVYTVSSWRDVIRLVLPKALEHGLAIADLPMPHAVGPASEAEAELAALHQAVASYRLEEHHLSVNIHGSAETIRAWIEEMAMKLGKTKWVAVATKNGMPFEC